MDKGYIMTYQAVANGNDLTVRIIGGTVILTFENNIAPALIAASIRAAGCVASPDGVEEAINQTIGGK